MIKKKEGYKGYCTHQPFNGNQIPIPGQNAVLRDYMRRQNLMFKLSNNEMNFPRCHLVLNSLLDQLPHLEGIVMTSVFMLPLDSEERWKIYDRVLEENCEMHCVFENLVIKTPDDVDAAEEIFGAWKVIQQCPTTIPSEFLPPNPGS